jgi:chorismate mutase
LLRKRSALGREAGQHKRAAGLGVRDAAREDRNRMRRAAWARAHGLDVDIIDALFERIVAWTRDVQERDSST